MINHKKRVHITASCHLQIYCFFCLQPSSSTGLMYLKTQYFEGFFLFVFVRKLDVKYSLWQVFHWKMTTVALILLSLTMTPIRQQLCISNHFMNNLHGTHFPVSFLTAMRHWRFYHQFFIAYNKDRHKT